MIGGTVCEFGKDPRRGDVDFALYHCTAHGISQEAVFDDSGTDMLYYRITVKVTGLVHGVTTWTKFQKRQLNQSVNSNAALETRGLRSQLDNRQTFRMRVGVTDDTVANSGVELVYAEPWPDSAVPAPAGGMLHWDVNDGPKCEVFNVEHIADNTVFKVSATFVVCVVECDPVGAGPEAPGTARNNRLGVLSNRWSSTDDIDVNRLTTRTYSGRLRVASSKINPHLLRAIVVPPLLKGLRRERYTFSVAVDGKSLDWTIVDREVVAAAPYPAHSWDISHSADTDHAMLTLHSVTVRLAGDRTSDPRQMIAIACFVIREKLYNDPNSKTITKRFSVQTDTGEQNTVRVSCDAMLAGKEVQGIGLTVLANYQTVGRPLTLAQMPQPNGAQYSMDLSRGSRPGDDIKFDGPVHLTGIFHARLQTPCNDAHNTDKRAEGGSQNDTTWPPPQPSVRQNPGTGPDIDVRIVDGDMIDTDASELSPGHRLNPYTSYTSESLYSSAGMLAAMPIARSFPTTTAAPSPPTYPPQTTLPIVSPQTQPDLSATETVKIIRLSGAVAKRIVRIKAERVGKWPILTRPTDYVLYGGYQPGIGPVRTGRAVVNDVRFLPGTIELTPTGEQLYRAQLEVEYLLTVPLDASQPLRVGANPWDMLGLQLTEGAAMFADEAAPPGALI